MKKQRKMAVLDSWRSVTSTCCISELSSKWTPRSSVRPNSTCRWARQGSSGRFAPWLASNPHSELTWAWRTVRSHRRLATLDRSLITGRHRWIQSPNWRGLAEPGNSVKSALEPLMPPPDSHEDGIGSSSIPPPKPPIHHAESQDQSVVELRGWWDHAWKARSCWYTSPVPPSKCSGHRPWRAPSIVLAASPSLKRKFTASTKEVPRAYVTTSSVWSVSPILKRKFATSTKRAALVYYMPRRAPAKVLARAWKWGSPLPLMLRSSARSRGADSLYTKQVTLWISRICPANLLSQGSGRPTSAGSSPSPVNGGWLNPVLEGSWTPKPLRWNHPFQ